MIDLRQAGLVVLLFSAIALQGCGGCQGEAPPKKEAAPAPQAPAAKPEAPAPAPTSTVAAVPPVGEMAPEEEGINPEDDDCFVMMDAAPDYGTPPLTVKFTTEVECNSGKPTIKWDFGDGSAGSSEENPTHVYEKEGEFVASVTVTGPSGGTDNDEMDITIEKGSSRHK